MFQNIDIVLSNTAPIGFGDYTADNCRIYKSHASAFSINTGAMFRNCEFHNTSGGNAYIACSVDNVFHECLIKDMPYMTIPSAAFNIHFTLCRFVDCGGWFTHFIACGAGVSGYLDKVRFNNCSFVGCGTAAGSVVSANSTLAANFNDCVFANNVSGCDTFDDATDSIFGNIVSWHYAATPGSPTIIRESTQTTLTSDPYADPSNGDWTLSSELAAITTANGRTPGAEQATGGGMLRVGLSGGITG